MELDPQPRTDHEQGGGARLRKLDFFRFCPCDSPSTAVETAVAQCTSRWAMAPRGHRLNTFIVLAAVHGLSGLFRAVSAVEPSLFPPLPPPPPPSPSLISRLASVDVKQNGLGLETAVAPPHFSSPAVRTSITAQHCEKRAEKATPTEKRREE